MKYLIKSCLLMAGAVLFAGCQAGPGQQSNGMVLTGEMEGQAFTIATGNEDEIFMDVVDAFNTMDLEAVWAHSADTISFHGSDGYVGPFTRADMEGLFSRLDSVNWEVGAVIPVQVVGSDRVNILADGRETMYFKDGTVEKRKLFERFIFEDGILVGVRQWEAAISDENKQE